MKTALYKIEALTNMHVGSGDANYGVIDNLVQRDVVTNYPTINGSSLKGALREFFVNKKFDEDKLKKVFGHDKRNADYRFLSANLLAIPMRSNKKAYFLATCPAIIKKFGEDASNFGFEDNLSSLAAFNPEAGKPIVFNNTTDGLLIENFGGRDNPIETETPPKNDTILGNYENLVILNDEDFNDLCNDFNLPVIARNKVMENKNLWYEQVVPSKSLFYFILLHNEKNFEDFNALFKDNIIHIGANATVGYGFTKIFKIN